MAAADWSASLLALGEKPGVQRSTEPLTPAAGPVCVTGGTGFIALNLIQQLLEKGYSVVATVRSDKNPVKLAPLLEMQGTFGEKLRIVGGVDCLVSESFDAAVAGCVGVFHTASPFILTSTDPMNELVEPAVRGTRSCLEACQRAGCVKRVVVTASFACIVNPGNPDYPANYAYSSRDWNVTSKPDASGALPEPVGVHGYLYSKLMAEKAAWDFQADSSFDVACINPPMVVGKNLNVPKTVEDLNTSSNAVLNILTGKQATKPHSNGWVDVRDVARAHIFAYEHPEAGGRRFLCATTAATWTEVAECLKELYPAFPVQTAAPEGGAGERWSLDTSGLQGLSGFQFTPLKDALKSQADSLIELGFAKAS